MGDDKKSDKKAKKKKLELNKETIKELSEQDLDQVAGGARSGGCVAPDGGPAGVTVSCKCPTAVNCY